MQPRAAGLAEGARHGQEQHAWWLPGGAQCRAALCSCVTFNPIHFLAAPHRSSCRLASAALALALGQSREEARSIITLKEVEPLIEAMYR